MRNDADFCLSRHQTIVWFSCTLTHAPPAPNVRGHRARDYDGEKRCAAPRASGWAARLRLLATRVAGFIGDEQHACDEDNNGCDYGPEHYRFSNSEKPSNLACQSTLVAILRQNHGLCRAA